MEFEFGEEILEATDDKAADRGDNLEEDAQGDDQGQAGNEGTGDQEGADGDEDAGEGDAQGDGEGEDGSGEDKTKAKGDKDQGHDHDQGDDPVPAARFREVIKQRNEVRDQIKAIQEQNKILLQTLETVQKSGGKTQDGQQGQQQGAQGKEGEGRFKDFDFKAKMSAYNDAVIDGDDEAAKELFGEILEYQNHMTEQRVVATIQNLNRAKETEASRQLAVDIVNRHQDALDAEPELADDMAYYRAKYERQGLSIKDALLEAEKKVFGDAGKADGDDDGGSEDHGESPAERRKREAIRRNAEAAQNQPPLPKGGKGQRSKTMPKDALSMSDDEYAKLPEEEKRRLRGDFV